MGNEYAYSGSISLAQKKRSVQACRRSSGLLNLSGCSCNGCLSWLGGGTQRGSVTLLTVLFIFISACVALIFLYLGVPTIFGFCARIWLCRSCRRAPCVYSVL